MQDKGSQVAARADESADSEREAFIRRPMTLSFRLALAFVAFVILGSLALLLWLGSEQKRQSREQFAVAAVTNARLIQNQKYPITDRTADALSDVLRMDVFFSTPADFEKLRVPAPNGALLSTLQFARDHQGTVVSLPNRSLLRQAIVAQYPDRKLSQTADRWEAVSWPIAGEVHLALLRPEPAFWTSILSGRTLAVLTAFWTLSLALAWALARGIVRPLRALAERLPRIAHEKSEPIPETRRRDEIGQLARAYAEARNQLAAERTAREQAERLATLGRMAAGLAHEINNPVAAIKLHTQLLEGESSSDPESRTAIILAEAAKIESLVSQWMFLTRPQPPQIVECDFGAILDDAIRALQPAARHARVTVANMVPPGTIVRVDRRRLTQSISNVITNAIHAMSAKGGTLEIRQTASEPVQDATHRNGSNGNGATKAGGGNGHTQAAASRFQFADSGPGFSTAALARATELFFSEKEGGMGIGLSVTGEILRAHGGELHLANASGGGAVVTFVLPAASQAGSMTGPQSES